MKQLKRNLSIYICMFVAVFCAMTLKAEAANVRTGTLGDNDGISWTYDEDNKTLTITGKDSGLQGDYNPAEYTYKSQFATICADVEVIKIQNCTLKGDATGVFAALSSLKTIECNNFDTSNVTSMKYMFYNCKNLSSLDVSHFDTSKVTDMCYMFYNCKNLSVLNVSSFDTSKVENMSFMFQGCRRLSSLDVSNFDTSNVGYMIRMFYDCSSLSSVDLSAFDLTTIVCADGMYYVIEMLSNCSNLTYIKTPKKMSAGMTTALPDTFLDAKGTEYKSITNTICGKTLYSRQMYNKVRAFVERMYTIVLGRAAEEQGLADWTARLLAKEIDGATLVDMFVNSDEFIARNTSDEEYIKILYRAVLGREADADGLKMWKDMLADDWTRDYIMEGLVLSAEFKAICNDYGITAAFEPTAESQVRSFVKRMYTVVLNRRADTAGLDNWTKQLMNGTVNGAKVADGFINSQEFANRNLSNEKYVKVLYRAFFNREADEGGFNVWMNELAKGTSRRDVMKGFVHSVEFGNLCAAYGIIRGEIQ